MGVDGHLAQIEAGGVGVASGIDAIGRVAAGGNVARHLGAEAPRVMHDERAVDAAAEQSGDRKVARQADAHGFDTECDPASRAKPRAKLLTMAECNADAEIAGQRIARRQQQNVAFGRGEERLNLRAKQISLRRLYQVERLDAEGVARGEKFPGRGVDRHEGIHCPTAA